MSRARRRETNEDGEKLPVSSVLVINIREEFCCVKFVETPVPGRKRRGEAKVSEET